jgi:hypothetical protein
MKLTTWLHVVPRFDTFTPEAHTWPDTETTVFNFLNYVCQLRMKKFHINLFYSYINGKIQDIIFFYAV